MISAHVYKVIGGPISVENQSKQYAGIDRDTDWLGCFDSGGSNILETVMPIDKELSARIHSSLALGDAYQSHGIASPEDALAFARSLSQFMSVELIAYGEYSEKRLPIRAHPLGWEPFSRGEWSLLKEGISHPSHRLLHWASKLNDNGLLSDRESAVELAMEYEQTMTDIPGKGPEPHAGNNYVSYLHVWRLEII